MVRDVQLAVSGNALDHTAIKVGPKDSENAALILALTDVRVGGMVNSVSILAVSNLGV